jgi:hypothetical protein
MVTCNLISGTDPPIGTCSNPNGNQPEGNVCGDDVNARHDCLGCASPKIQCCKLDGLGVPRCYGTPGSGDCATGYTGAPGCCIAAGQTCSFSSECCDGVPCVPDSSGVLRCAAQTCVAASGVCTATGDCCAGLQCEIPIGGASGVCKSPGGSDGGTCALGGQSCGDQTACCTGYVCDALGGATRCPPGGMGCTCYRFVP